MKRWEIHLRLEDGSTESLAKAWTLIGAKRKLGQFEAARVEVASDLDWSVYVWDNQTGTPVVFS